MSNLEPIPSTTLVMAKDRVGAIRVCHREGCGKKSTGKKGKHSQIHFQQHFFKILRATQNLSSTVIKVNYTYSAIQQFTHTLPQFGSDAEIPEQIFTKPIGWHITWGVRKQ